MANCVKNKIGLGWFFLLLSILILKSIVSAESLNLNIQEGKPAPDFTLSDQKGKMISLSNFKGKSWVVLYFYPKDDSPGCTKEACDFRDNLIQIQQLDATVLGISVDSVKSHKNFADKFNLNFSILSDSEYKVTRQYGVLTQFMGMRLANRSTFIVDPEGIIQKIFPKVDPKDHAREIIAEMKKLKG